MNIRDEKFKLCDLVIVNFKDGKKLYKAMVYSNLTEQTVGVYIPHELFEQLLTMYDNIDPNDYFERVFNSYKKEFEINYKK